MGTLVSVKAALLGVSIHRLVERAWMRAIYVQTLAHTRLLGRRHARFALAARPMTISIPLRNV
jgi:hypothetical protein